MGGPGHPKLSARAYRGSVHGLDVVVVWAGRCHRYNVNNVATTAATVSAYASIVEFNPQVVLSAGTAGAFRSAGGANGDVYLSTKSVFHSRRIPSGGDGLRRYEEFGFGNYRSPPVELLAFATGCKMGVVSTSDSLDHTARDMQIMHVGYTTGEVQEWLEDRIAD